MSYVYLVKKGLVISFQKDALPLIQSSIAFLLGLLLIAVLMGAFVGLVSFFVTLHWMPAWMLWLCRAYLMIAAGTCLHIFLDYCSELAKEAEN